MTVIADVRGNIRIDLKDTDAQNYRWTDAELDRHIQRAVKRFSYAWPREYERDIDTEAGSRKYDLVTGKADMMNLIDVREVEYPANEYPRNLVPFTFNPPNWLHIHVDPPPDGTYQTKVCCDMLHTLSDAACTIPDYLLDIVEHGAAGFAAQEWANYAINRINVDENAVKHYKAWGAERIDLFYRDLGNLKRKRVQDGRSTTAFAGFNL